MSTTSSVSRSLRLPPADSRQGRVLATDVEMMFMYPWTVVVASMGTGSVVEMFVFLGVLVGAP